MRKLSPSRHNFSLTGKQRSAAQQQAARTFATQTIAAAAAQRSQRGQAQAAGSWWLDPARFYELAHEAARRLAGNGFRDVND